MGAEKKLSFYAWLLSLSLGARMAAVIFVLGVSYYWFQHFVAPKSKPTETSQTELMEDAELEPIEPESRANSAGIEDGSAQGKKPEVVFKNSAPSAAPSSTTASKNSEPKRESTIQAPAIYMATDSGESDPNAAKKADERFMKWDSLTLGDTKPHIIKIVPECEEQLAAPSAQSRFSGVCNYNQKWGSVQRTSYFLRDDKLVSMRLRVLRSQVRRFYRSVENQWGPAHGTDAFCRNRGDGRTVVAALRWESERAFARICQYATSGAGDQEAIRVSIGFKSGDQE